MYDRRKFASELMGAGGREQAGIGMLQNDILLVVQGARRMLEHASRGLLRQSGLRLVELDVLCFLANAGAGDTARDISEARKISKAHISKAVDNLRRAGCITLRHDEEDRRCLHLSLTPQGRAYADAYFEVRRGVACRLMEGIKPGGTAADPHRAAKNVPQHPAGGRRHEMTDPANRAEWRSFHEIHCH